MPVPRGRHLGTAPHDCNSLDGPAGPPCQRPYASISRFLVSGRNKAPISTVAAAIATGYQRP